MPNPTTARTVKADLAAIRKRAQAIIDAHAERDKDFESYERIYQIAPNGDDEGRSSAARARLLFDPHGHNTVDSCVKMYIVSPPAITIPAPATEARDGADKSERFLKALLYASNVVSERDFIADSLYAAALYGEVPQVIDNVLAELAETDEPSELEAPIVFSVPSPKTSYPRYSTRSGLFQHIFKERTTAAEVRAHYGAEATAFLTGSDDADVTLMDYMDRYQHTVWLDEYPAQPLLEVALDYGFIPRVSRRGASPGFFEQEQYKRMPMLYAYLKAGLWAARNVALTSMYTNIMDHLNPIMLATMKEGRAAPRIDWSKRGSTVTLEVGEEMGPLVRNLVPPEMFSYLNLLQQFVEDSTMSRVVRGDSPGQGMAASALNLLTVSTRMATFLVARTVELATAATFSRTLRWIAARGQPVSVWGEQGAVALAPSDIAQNFHVRVKLKPDQQAEKQMIAGLATQLFTQAHLGYDTFLEMLEEGGIIESANEAFDNIVERAVLEAKLPALGKQSRGAARAMGRAPLAEGVPPGVLPPDIGNLPGGEVS